MNYDEPKQMTEVMRVGLARMYADEGFKSFLVNAINISNHNIIAAIKLGKMEDAKVYTTRLETLKNLLDKGKMCFTDVKKKNVKEPLLALELANNEKKHEVGSE